MSALRDIRKRLSSVESTQKITRAMEMVASARLRKALIRSEATLPYTQSLQKMVEQLCHSGIHHPFFEAKPARKIGLVIISADHGLCGPFHTNLFSIADRFLAGKSKNEVELFLVGHKAVSMYANKQWKVRQKVEQWTSAITTSLIDQLAGSWMQSFLQKELDEIWVLYTRYTNILKREAVIEKFLNLERPDAQTNLNTDYLFEPSALHVINQLLPRYCKNKVQWYLLQSYQSELSARVVSMKAASKNADTVIEKLIHTRDKIRQENITKEMLEITAGAQSLV